MEILRSDLENMCPTNPDNHTMRLIIFVRCAIIQLNGLRNRSVIIDRPSLHCVFIEAIHRREQILKNSE